MTAKEWCTNQLKMFGDCLFCLSIIKDTASYNMQWMLLLVTCLLICWYYLYIELQNTQVCNKVLLQYKIVRTILPAGSVLLFANKSGYVGQQLFYTYSQSCFTHVAIVVELQGSQYALEIGYHPHRHIPESIMPPRLNIEGSDVTLSVLAQRILLYDGLIFARSANKKAEEVLTLQQIKSYMRTIKYYEGSTLLSVWLHWLRQCQSNEHPHKTCVDFVYRVLSDMRLFGSDDLPTCQMPQQIGDTRDSSGALLFAPAIRLS